MGKGTVTKGRVGFSFQNCAFNLQQYNTTRVLLSFPVGLLKYLVKKPFEISSTQNEMHVYMHPPAPQAEQHCTSYQCPI